MQRRAHHDWRQLTCSWASADGGKSGRGHNGVRRMTAYIWYGLLLLHGVVTCGLFLYGMNCYVLLCLHRRAWKEALQHDGAVQQAWQARTPQYPRVTVQLPIYNERYVIQRLVEAVARLCYPRAQLEIQILDDSTDETTAMALRLVERYRHLGFDITVQHRPHRHGYKAGALAEGLTQATGEFIAIFDADFVPAPDFLLRTLPFFQEPAIAMVQTRWGHLNRTYSRLTLAQAFGIDGHFGVEQTARCGAGLFLNFNGSGGIWRRQAIEDAGGWQADTLTEDLDLSYRAQLRGWRMQFVPHVVCPAELPVQMSGVKSQQHRWAKGSIQTAKKLLPRVLQADLPRFTKCQAILHLTNYLVHPLMLWTALLTPLLLQAAPVMMLHTHLLTTMGIVCATLGPASLYLYAQRQLYPDWLYRLWSFPYLLIFGTGIALSNTRAILEALGNVQGTFVRTPKFRIEHPSDTWVGKHDRAAFPWLSLGELGLAVYSGYGTYLAAHQGAYLLLPFLLLYTLGFAAVAGLSLGESYQAVRPHGPSRTHRRVAADTRK
jgi:cellulose synthase/poly-beta-1,6-N-acetylglucosamine synthase-like glycosyltransferase